MNIEYYFCLAAKNKGYEVRLRFDKEDFHHLEGFGQLRDIPIHRERGSKSFDMALTGEITEEYLKSSELFIKNKVKNKIDYLYLLETALDHNDMVFRCIKDQSGRIKLRQNFFCLQILAVIKYIFTSIKQIIVIVTIFVVLLLQIQILTGQKARPR